MEGSSEGGLQRPDNTSRGLHSSTVSGGEQRLLSRSIIRSTDDNTSQGSVFNVLNSVDALDHAIECSDVSLRQWLDNPERTVDGLECLHIFTQIVEIVNLAHSQGIVVHNLRPSCFVMSSYNRVSFIESASCSDSGSDSSEDEPNNQTEELKGSSSFPSQPCQDISHSVTEMNRRSASDLVSDTSQLQSTSGNAMPEQLEEEKPPLPIKQILLVETTWYTSPEELAGDPGSCTSDVYRLGVLLFELFCTFSSAEQKSTSMCSLRHRVLPPQLLLKWPKEASFCLWLLHPDPSSRPKMGDLMQSEFLNEPRNHLLGRDAVIELRERIEEQELLLEFLLLIQKRKQEAADSLHETISFLSSDIEKVMKLQKALGGKGGFSCEHGRNSVAGSTSTNFIDDGDLASLGSRKRFRPRLYAHYRVEYDKHLDEDQRSETPAENQAHILSKSSRFVKNFRKLEAAYFLTRCRAYKPAGKPLSKHHHPISRDGRESIPVTDRSSMINVTSREKSDEDGQNAWIYSFLEGLCKYLSIDKLKVKADLKQADLLNSSNLVCSVGFDRDGEFFATAGVNKKIKVFEYNSILDEDWDIHYPVVEMASKSNMSSICWNPYIKSQIASSNFEGVVQVWDVTRGQIFTEMREHERRTWCVDFSVADPTMLASGSDDCSVKLWNINQGASVGSIRTKANICCVQFQSGSSRSLAFGSADHRIYYYDLRNAKMPVCTLIGHKKTVSYVKFIDSTTLVSASTDNSLKLWDLSVCTSQVIDCPLQSFTGHMNTKNFVGLSVSDGYIATGSETNEVFVYHKAFPMPALSYKFNSTDPLSGDEEDDSPQFISSVCWRGQSSTLLAANSLGNIKILEMV